MKRILKRLAALATILALTFALAAPGLAAGATAVGGGATANTITNELYTEGNLANQSGDYSITIAQAVDGMPYTLFKLFDVEYVENTETGEKEPIYTIDSDSPMFNYLASAAGFFVEFEQIGESEKYSVKWMSGDMAESTTLRFANSARQAGAAVIKAAVNADSAEGSEGSEGGNYEALLADPKFVFGTKVPNGGTVRFTNLPAGYYVVSSALVTLSEQNPKQSVEDKLSANRVTKQVWENSADLGVNGPNQEQTVTADIHWGQTNDAAVGDTVWFKTTTTLGPNARIITTSDEMLEELVNMKRMTNTMYAAIAGIRALTLFDRMDAGFTWSGKIEKVYWKEKETGEVHDITSDLAPKEGGVGKDGLQRDFILTLNGGFKDNSGSLDELVNMKRSAVGVGGTNPSQIGYGAMLSAVYPYTFSVAYNGVVGADDELIFIYSATVNSHAVVGSAGNINKAQGGGSKSSTTTYVHEFDLVKIDSGKRLLDGAEFELQDSFGTPIPLVPCNSMRTVADKPWEGVVFQESLYQTPSGGTTGTTSGTNPVAPTYYEPGRKTFTFNATIDEPEDPECVAFQQTYPGGEVITPTEDDAVRYYRVATPEEQAADGFQSTTIKAGNVRIQGLDSGYYLLEEITAPEGYNALTEKQPFAIVDGDLEELVNMKRSGETGSASLNGGKPTGEPTLLVFSGLLDDEGTEAAALATFAENDETAYEAGGLAIVNLTGRELPHTGGMGTTMLYTVGALLVAGAGILLIARKRMGVEEL